MKRTLILTAVLVALLSIGLVVPVSGTEPPPEPGTPDICLIKSCPETATPGETITYEYWVENCGDLPLLGSAWLYDELINPAAELWKGELYPGDIYHHTETYILPVDHCGPWTNNAWAKGHPLAGDVYLDWVYAYASCTTNIECPPPGGEGCTPGYWKNLRKHGDQWMVYTPSDDFEAVFGVNASFGPIDLGSAVRLGGGGENALARHAVAALLNATSPNIGYLYSEAEVITIVQDAYATGDFEAAKDLLEAQNDPTFCPLD